MREEIILASSSPRRKEILEMLGLDFKIDPADIDESVFEEDRPEELVKVLSYEKAKAVADKYDSGYVIGSDTIVYFDGEIILKPRDYEDALAILSKLNANTNQVYTGITIINAKTGEEFTDYDLSEVTFKNNSLSTLKAFIEKDKPYDKSGSYSISGLGSIMIEEIKGDFYSILGLSVRKLTDLFEKHGEKLL